MSAEMTAWGIREAIGRGEFGAEEVVRSYLDRIEGRGAELGCFLQTFPERALERAREIDGMVGRGEAVGPLAGVPIALKDNICLEWGRTTCASRILESYESPFSATVARRLKAAGAVIVGKTNMDEFAMGSSGENSAMGVTRNPWALDRAPGGSSSGSAAAVAARLVPVALGSDTGGSVRQPASFCGIVGLKPTYGRVSRWGLVAFASSLDQIGPLTTNVRDAALVLGAISGHDELDSTSAHRTVEDFVGGIGEPIDGLRLGVPREVMSGANDPAVDRAFREAVDVYSGMGAEIVEVGLPHLEHGIAAYYIVAPAEASSNLARYDGIRFGRRAELAEGEGLEDLYARSRAEGFGDEVQRRIMLGTYALSSGYYDAYYLTALKTRRRIKEDFDRVFDGGDGAAGCDAILTPTTPTPAFGIGEKVDDPLAMYMQDVYTVLANMAGLPAISLPMGFAEDGGAKLPLGLQICAPAFEEGKLLRIAGMYEGAVGACVAPG